MPYCANCGSEIKDGYEFCAVCGSKIQKTEQQTSPSVPNQRTEVFQGEIRKCPNCGEPLKAFTLNCPACGFEIRGVDATSSVKQLAQKLEQIENNREYEKPKRFMTSRNSERISKADEQKISLIRSFAVPNTFEDIMEFMILASTNIDYSLYSKADTTYDKARKSVAEAWLSKVEQVYLKAKNSFGDKEDFYKIEEIYKDCKEKVKKKKKTKIIKWALMVGWIPLVFIIIMVIPNNYPERQRKEEQRLESIVAEVESFIEEDNYQAALRHAQAIEYDLPDDDKQLQWKMKKEDLIDEIIQKANASGVELERPTEAEPTSYLDYFK